MFIGTLLWGQVSDNFGRKKALFVSSLFTGISALVAVFSPNWVVLLVARFLTGIGVGSAHVPFSLFSELLPTQYRGQFLLYMQMLFNIGAIIASGLAWILLPQKIIFGIDAWRLFMLGCATPVLILLSIVPFIPESPRYLYVQKQYDEAELVLHKIMKWNRKPIMEGKLLRPHDDNTVDIELQDKEAEPVPVPQSPSLYERIRKISAFSLFSKKYWRITIALLVIWFVNAFCYYGAALMTPSYFQSKDTDGYFEVFITSVAEIPGIFLAAFLINRIGRKRTQMFLLCCCGVFMFCLLIPGPIWLMTIFAVITRLSVNGSFGVIYVFTPELFPTVMRGIGMGACTCFSRIGGIITPYVATVLFKLNSWIPLIIYGTACLIGALLTFIVPVETTGQHLQDEEPIQE
jgi:MFS family permease